MMTFLFWVIWLVIGSAILIALYYIDNSDNDDITVRMIPVIILLVLVWPITLCVVIGVTFDKYKDVVLYSRKEDE